MIAYVHIEYSVPVTNSRKSKGGLESTPCRNLRRLNAGSDRVQERVLLCMLPRKIFNWLYAQLCSTTLMENKHMRFEAQCRLKYLEILSKPNFVCLFRMVSSRERRIRI